MLRHACGLAVLRVRLRVITLFSCAGVVVALKQLCRSVMVLFASVVLIQWLGWQGYGSLVICNMQLPSRQSCIQDNQMRPVLCIKSWL
jgi:hypothetical protein